MLQGGPVAHITYYEQMDLNKLFPLRIFVCDGNTRTNPHWHREVEVLLMLDGILQMSVNDNFITMHKGDIMFIQGGNVHSFYYSPHSHRLVLQFDTNMLSSLPLFHDSKTSFETLFDHIDGDSTTWSSKLQMLVKCSLDDMWLAQQQDGTNRQLIQYADLFDIVRQLAESAPRVEPEDDNYPANSMGVLKSVFAYVEGHYAESISLDQISAAVGLQKNYFCRFFKKYMNETFGEFLVKFRVNKAKFLLETTLYNLSEVAYQAGFPSYKTMYLQFRKETGVAPHQYRKII